MPLVRLETTDACWIEDPRLADYRNVRDPELVRRGARFLAEGRLVVWTLLTDSRLQPRSVLLEEPAVAWFQARGVLWPLDLPVYVVPAGAMEAVTGFQFHQGCLAAGERPDPIAPADLLAGLAPTSRLVVALDGVSNPDNVGAIFRSAAAFGAGAILLGPDCASPLYRKAMRTSMGAALRMPYCHGPAWRACLDALRAGGFATVALTLDADADALDDAVAKLPLDRPRALLLGAERTGLSAVSLEAAAYQVRIPMAGGIDSLNVAAAAAVALYRLR